MGQNMGLNGGWISPNSHSQTNSPRFSPDPSETQAATAAGAAAGYPVNSSMGMVRKGGRVASLWFVEPLNNGHTGKDYFVHYREVVLSPDAKILPLVHWKASIDVSFIQNVFYQRFHWYPCV